VFSVYNTTQVRVEHQFEVMKSSESTLPAYNSSPSQWLINSSIDRSEIKQR
jgi:hypothetical protein